MVKQPGFKKLQLLIVSFCLILSFLPSEISAKNRMTRAIAPEYTRMAGVKSVRMLEEHFKPFLESRLVRNKNPISLTPDQVPTDFDFQMLARVYNNLSPEFKALYEKATALPDSSSIYKSPRGHFEVYYYKSGPDSVDTTDNYGFDSLDNQINKPNGIPDYVDEVAWALDSSWSMEVDRFGFPAPIPYQNTSHSSNRYKVVIEHQAFNNYGLTYIGAQTKQNSPGYSSYISLRNEWSGYEWSQLGYEKHPENGVRVTCVHEFFHAIQYAMSRNVVGDIFLDDFPLSWTEGSAVLMEELGFSDINDYIQYSNVFFTNPSMQLFSRSLENDYIYSSSILIMYLYKFAYGFPSVDFVHDVLTDNYQHQITFQQALYDASSKTGHPWTELLNNFHTASFFTGNRADTGIFLDDAALLSSWHYSIDSLDSYMTINKSVNPTAMNTFAFKTKNFTKDSVSFFLGPLESSDSSSNDIWTASAIFRNDLKDSIVNLKLDKAGNSVFSLEKPISFNELLFIITNGDFSAEKNYLVTYLAGAATYKKGDTADFKITSKDSKCSAEIVLHALNDLHYSLSLNETANNPLLDSAKNHSLIPMSSLFDISYPLYWKNSAEIDLNIKTTALNLQSKDSISIYRWIPSSSSWTPVTTDCRIDGELKTECSDPGFYCAFRIYNDTSSDPITVCNFASIKNNQKIIFQDHNANTITDIQIYSVNGQLIWKAYYPKSPLEKTWDPKIKTGVTIIPGLYLAVVRYKDQNMSIKTIKKRIIVAP
jgi:hypothetical protein